MQGCSILFVNGIQDISQTQTGPEQLLFNDRIIVEHVLVGQFAVFRRILVYLFADRMRFGQPIRRRTCCKLLFPLSIQDVDIVHPFGIAPFFRRFDQHVIPYRMQVGRFSKPGNRYFIGTQIA